MEISKLKDPHQTGLDESLVDLFFSQAETIPERIFCRFQSKESAWVSMSYDEARKRIVSLAEGFSALGLKRNDGLAILAKTRWEWTALELAALRLGGFVTGIEPQGSTEDIVFRIKHSRVRALAIETAEVPRLPESVLKSLDFLIFLDGSTPPSTAVPEGVTFEQLESMGKNNLYLPWPTAEDKAALIYTSGTTGQPKAISYNHRQVISAVRAVENALSNLGPRDSVLCWLPIAHLFQRMINYVAISRGAPMAFLSDPRHVLEAAKKIRPTIILGVPRFFEKLHHRMEEALGRLPRWAFSLFGKTLIYPLLRRVLGGKIRIMITGSAPTALADVLFFERIGLPLYEAYGVSENTIPISMNLPHAVRLGSVGRPLKENHVRLTPEREICVKGPGVCAGYWNSGTDLPVDAEGYYHTGDLGRQDAEGFLYILGRRDDMFKTSTGRKISPTRLETVYGQSPLFDRVMAVGRGKPFPSLLIWLTKEFSGSPEKGGELLLTSLQRERIQQEIGRLGAELLSYERAGAFLAIAGSPNIVDGTLTPSLKLRRAVLEGRWAERIDTLYSETSGHSLPGSAQPVDSVRPKKGGDRPRILFLPEGVALSHPARLFQLARQLDPEKFEIHMAVDRRFRWILGPTNHFLHDMGSLPPSTFNRRVARGGIVYTEEELERFVQQELTLFKTVQPDIVVGDWRPSLGISSAVARIPYVSVLNAYWNPDARIRHVLPEYTATEWIPRFLGQALFNVARPMGYAMHARPVNAVRRRHHLTTIPDDFRLAVASPDWTLYPDLERLFPIPTLPAGHRYMPPLSWSPLIPLPEWWNRPPSNRPVVYANLGSTGRPGTLRKVMEALATLPVSILAATAGHQTGLVPPPNVFVADYLPGQTTAARADVVITNGGNMSAYQALGEGKPILGLASNADQFLNMAALEDAGAGTLLRAGSCTVQEIRTAVQTLLNESKFRQTCNSLGKEITEFSRNVFRETVDQILESGRPSHTPTQNTLIKPRLTFFQHSKPG